MTRSRLGTAADSQACFEVMEASIDDFGRRTGTIPNGTFGDPRHGTRAGRSSFH